MSESIDIKLSYIYNGIIKQCAVYPWIHNISPNYHCLRNKCKNFIKIQPLHPHPAMECKNRVIKYIRSE